MSARSERQAMTVIVPTYRRPEDLRRCLHGLAQQERLPDETLVIVHVEDRETQDSLADPGELGDRIGLRLVLTDRLGQIPQMNEGLAVATGEVVCFTDDDCVPRPDWLSRLERHYADLQVGGAGGRDLVHTPNGVSEKTVRSVGRITLVGRVIGHHHDLFAGDPVFVDHLKGANMSFRRSVLPPFDERLAGGSCALNDTDASLSVRAQGYRLVYDPQALVDHYPAARYGESTRRLHDPRLVASDAHNWAYCMCKHLSGPRRVLFVLFATLVGSGNRLGLLKYLQTVCWRPTAATRQLWASWRGLRAGLRSCHQARAAGQRACLGGETRR